MNRSRIVNVITLSLFQLNIHMKNKIQNLSTTFHLACFLFTARHVTSLLSPRFLARAQASLEVPEEHRSGLRGDVLVLGPAEEGSTGQREAGAGVDTEGPGALGVLLPQGVITQVTVIIPARGLLATRSQGGQGQPQA